MSFNTKLAEKITNGVSTMWCAYLFALLALLSLPAALKSHQLIIIVAWVAQTFLQLVLLSVIMVGQKIQSNTTIDAVTDHVDERHSELQKLHDKLSRDILGIHKHFNIKQENHMDNVKQHVEAAIAAIEADVVDPSIQIVKDKLIDIRDFLDRVETEKDDLTPEEVTGEAPAPLENTVQADPAGSTPVDGTPAPAVEDAPVPSTDEQVNHDDVVDPNATPAPIEPPLPVTTESGDAVTDPNAPR